MITTGEAKSQPNFPQNRWVSSGEQKLTRSRSLSAQKNLERQEQQTPRQRPLTSIPSRPESRASRPTSRLGSRPVSRLDSRPVSRLDSRPASRLDKQEWIAPIERPKSGTVRPLSGRIFMRRTSEKGWVAKAYPKPSSQPNLELVDDLSDCDSLDSFFDDDFETGHHQDKLQNLLSCNTLGVESKGKRPDWVAGEVGIPTFHCPRCRDHWYGITPFPCDEELARLIREGMWYTGKGDPSKATRNSRSGKFRRPVSGKKEFGSLSSDSLILSDEKKRRRHRRGEDDSRDPFSLAAEDSEETKRRSKKRITFKLDNSDEDDSYDGSSAEYLDGFGDGRSGRTTSNSRGQRLGGDNGDDTSRDGYGRGGKDGTSRLGGGNGPIDATGSGSKLGRRRGRRGGADGLDSEGSGDLFSGGGSTSTGDRRSGSGHLGSRPGKDGIENGSGRFGTKTERNRRPRKGTQGGDGLGDELGSQVEFDSWDRGTGTRTENRGSGFHSGSTFTGQDSFGNGDIGGDVGRGRYSDGSGGFAGDKGSLNGSHTNLGSSSQLGGGRGASEGGRGGLGGRDSGSKLFQRISHSQQSGRRQGLAGSDEDGDFDGLTSAGSSTTGGLEKPTSQNNIGPTGGPESQSTDDDFTLPPIVPQIVNKDPLIDLSALMYGFQVTKPYTFSYHLSTSRICLDSTSEKSRKKR